MLANPRNRFRFGSEMRMLITATKEENPEGLMPDEGIDHSFSPKPLKGSWYRLLPSTARDVFYLRSLVHRIDKVAPARGAGVLVRESALPMMG